VSRRLLLLLLLLLGVFALPGAAQDHIDYERPVDTAPQPDDIGEDYQLPEVQTPLPRAQWRAILDVGLLAAALGLGAWIVLKRRSRAGSIALTVACLAYFGFYREGCICAIGAIQNVAVMLANPDHPASYIVVVVFFLPLIAALFFGRVYCGGVCPLGAIQELVVLKPVQVPRRLDRALGSLKWIYLALAIYYAVLPAVDRDFIICRYDPFVGFFRMTGFAHMLWIGAGLLVLGLFVGRAYCRYLCPYGVLLSLASRLSWRGVSITPERELDCGLCVDACPYGAIEELRAVRHNCLFCARCYPSCPNQKVLEASRGGEEAPQ